MRKARFSLVAINVLVFVVLAEIAAVAFYYVRHGDHFYTADKESPAALVETTRG